MMKAERMPRFNRCAAAVLVVLGLLSGCEGSVSMSAAEHLARAREFQAKGNRQSAVIEIKSAIQKNPKSGEARWQLGELYAKTGLGAEAEKELLKAEELGIGMEALKPALGRAYLLQGKFDRLLAEIDVPSNSSDGNAAKILALRGNAHTMMGKMDEGCAMFAQAKKKDQKNPDSYWGLARCALAKGDMKEARAELTATLTVDPTNGESWAMLGDLEYLERKFKAADTSYTKAIEFAPQNAQARLGRAISRIEDGSLDAAQNDIQVVLRQQTPPRLAHHLNGIVLFRRGKYDDASAAFELARRGAEGYPPAVLWLGLTAYAKKDFEQAIEHLTAFSRMAPEAADAKALLAYLHARAGGKPAAAKILDSLKNVNLENPMSLANIGQAYMLIGEKDLAVATLKRAADKQPGSAESQMQFASALLAKGDTELAITKLDTALQLDPKSQKAEELKVRALLNDKRYDDALKALEGWEKQSANDPLPHNYRGAVFLAQKRPDLAQAAFAKALAIKPGFPLASHNLARMSLQEGKIEQARTYYEDVLRTDAMHAPTLVALANLELAADHVGVAEKHLQTALRQNPAHPTAAALLARLYLIQGQPLKALQSIDAAAKAHTADPALLEVKVMGALATDDLGNARAAADRLVQVQPKSADAYIYLANIGVASGDRQGARRALLQALNLDPKHFRAKAALARLELNDGKVAAALKLAQELRAEWPRIAESYVIEAEAHSSLKDFQKALVALDEGRRNFPDSTALVLAQAKALWLKGQSADSITSLLAWDKEHPDNLEIVSFLGTAYSAQGRDQEAASAFENAVRLAPRDGAMLNNLAWALRKTDPARALSLAQQANEIKPNSAALMDTLGYLLTETGQARKGVEMLRQAVDLAPQTPSIRYRYGAALAKAGERSLARRELEKAIASTQAFPERDSAKELVKGL